MAEVKPTIVQVGTLGVLKSFDPATDDFEMWVTTYKSFLIANRIDLEDATSQKKCSGILLASLGLPTVTLLHHLLSPAKPEDTSVPDIISTLQNYHNPAPKALAERFKFMGRRQKTGESVQEYIAELRTLAAHCKFEKELENRLRDQFIFGLASEAAQRTLFTKDDNYSLKSTVAVAVAQEAAEASTALVRGQHVSLPEQAVHKTGSRPPQHHGKKKNTTPPSEKGKVRNSQTNNKGECSRCGYSQHNANNCPNKDKTCSKCGKVGHFAKMCKSRTQTHMVNLYNVRMTQHAKAKKADRRLISINVKINGRLHQMELDTGCEMSILSSEFWKTIGSPKLSKSNYVFKTYTNETFHPIGELKTIIEYEGQRQEHSIPVTSGTSLFGKDLLRKFRIDWNEVAKQIHNVKTDAPPQQLKKLLQQYDDIFKEPTSTDRIRNFRARVILREDAEPRFLKARPLPFAIREKVDRELEQMERTGVIEKIEYSEWASPLVVVPKANGRVRITGDFKNTVNSQLHITQYPLALPEDIFATVSGGRVFSKLDGSNAYHQLELEESSKRFMVINTHRGLYRYNTLPQGIASSPAIFQEFMDRMLKNIEKTGSYIDDSISSAVSTEAHLDILKKIFDRMREFNFKLSKDKCEFMKLQVIFLGHLISERGIETTEKRIEAIQSMPVPQDKTELKSFLGMVNFYARFVKNLSELCAPLNRLTGDGEWKWTSSCQKAYLELKSRMSQTPILAHFQPELPIGISCDASQHGLGVVLYHKYRDGTERPIAYASKTLSPTEQRYSQIEKEGYAIVYGIRKFFKYLCGRKFTLITDHKPLLAIFGPKAQLPVYVATRLHHWSLYLSQFQYDVEYRKSQDHGNADALSRLPMKNLNQNEDEAEKIVHFLVSEQLSVLPITASEIRKATSKDKTLARVYQYVIRGWPKQLLPEDQDLQQYFAHREDLTLMQNVLMMGIRVVIPTKLREPILQKLHECHFGIVKMKTMARSYIWWPAIDYDIEKLCRECEHCQSNKPDPSSAPLHPWPYPDRPWQRVHMDLAGPLFGKMWLIMMDARTKWPEVFCMTNDTTALAVISRVTEAISRWGIPDQIVTDNGRQFVASEFSTFCQNNGIKHNRSSAYHPRSNGEAERFVRTFKEAMRATDVDVNMRLLRFLFCYRSTPHSTTGFSPAELLQGRRLRTSFDLIRPDPATAVEEAQNRQEKGYNKGVKMRTLIPGAAVWVKSYSKNLEKWTRGKVIKALGPLTYMIDLNGKEIKRHIDQIREAGVMPDIHDDAAANQGQHETPPASPQKTPSRNSPRQPTPQPTPPRQQSTQEQEKSPPLVEQPVPSQGRPKRTRKQVEKYRAS